MNPISPYLVLTHPHFSISTRRRLRSERVHSRAEQLAYLSDLAHKLLL